MDSTELRELTRHMEWADALAWSTVLDLPAAREDARLLGLLHHTHAVQCTYHQLWVGEPLAVPEPDAFGDLGALLRWGRDVHARVGRFVGGLDAEALARTIDVPWARQLVESPGAVHPASVRQSLLQVTSHSTYHRGQVATRVRELGGEPALTDFVVWVWRGAPPPAWPGPRT